MKLFIVLLCTAATIGLSAQTSGGEEMDIGAHKTISYLGAGVSQPMFIGKDSKALGYWQGLSLKSGLFFMQAQWGRTIDKQLDSNTYIGRGFTFSWGIRFSKPTTKPGRMALGTFALKPKIDFGITFAHIPHDTLVTGFSYPMSLGMHMSPGLIMRASSIYLIASCDVDIVGSVDPMFKPQEKHFNLGRGIIISPSLTLGFDNGWEILAPVTRKGEGTFTVTEFHYTGESWRTYDDPVTGRRMEEHTTRGYTTSHTGVYTYQLRKIDAFMGIGPVMEFYTNANRGQTQMVGGEFGFKASFLKVDAQYLTGWKGLGNGLRDDYAQKAMYNGQRINYTSAVRATEMSVKAGVNVVNFLYPKSHFESDADGRIKVLGTTFYGLCFYYKYGQMTFSGDPVYTFEGAEQSLDAAFAGGLGEQSAATDARMLPASSIMQGLGMSIDFGMVSVGIERMRFNDAPIADGLQGSISLVIPVRRTIRMARLRAGDRKKNKENK